MWSSKADRRTVSIIVYGAKGLKPKTGKHKYAVTCEIGSSSCRTEVIEDLFDNPVFNKELQLQIDTVTAPLVLIVTEKHEKNALGQISIPLYSLIDQCTNSPLRVPLQPHKRCHDPSGEIIYEAWISTVVPKPEIANGSTPTETVAVAESFETPTGLQKLMRRKFNYSPNPGSSSSSAQRSSDPKSGRRHSSDALINLKPFSSPSGDSVFDFLPTDNLSLQNATVDLRSVKSVPEVTEGYRKRSSLSIVSEQNFEQPQITRITPTDGPETGGTVVTIEGRNLGLGKEDVVGLLICGSDVVDSVQYLSPLQIRCTTAPCRPCVGNVIVETQSGGRASSSVQFTFSEVPRTTNDAEEEEEEEVDAVDRRRKIGVGARRTKARPPVGEIQPMPPAAVEPVVSFQMTYDDVPPKKPPRANVLLQQQGKEMRVQQLQATVDGMGRPTEDGVEMKSTVIDTGVCWRGDGGKSAVDADKVGIEHNKNDYNMLANLKAQLTANHDHILQLEEENEVLKEQYTKLHMYIETLLYRVCEVCPQVLCIDCQ